MLKIIKGGLQTTVQDHGRTGFQKYGVIMSGAMDHYALRLANLLAGNSEYAAALEIALTGPKIEFTEDAFIALCGGNLSPKINGEPVGMWRPIAVQKGSTLSFGAPASGCRTYLAVGGGISVPEVMGSKSTYLRAAIGGFKGRALTDGDKLETAALPASRQALLASLLSGQPYREMNWRLPSPSYPEEPVVRLMPGRQFELFDADSKKKIFTEAFKVSSQSDRMGYRLEGCTLSLAEPKELISEAVAFGSIQVPPDGNPIILLADRQTTGGYPKIGQVASVDLPLVSQSRPGSLIRFREISLNEAQQLVREQEMEIRQLTMGIQLKWEEWS